MKYFIDTEFIETEKRNSFFGIPIGRPIPTIDLISIGIVCEDGREYYAVSSEFDREYASEWVEDNVIRPIIYDAYSYSSAQEWRLRFLRTRKMIRQEILEFIGYKENNEFYGYFSDYDWVVFCWLFGRMIDLPGNFPMYCIDLKQMMHERGLTDDWKDSSCPQPNNVHNALEDAKWNRELYNKIIEHKIK